MYGGSSSAWWKIPDGCKCVVFPVAVGKSSLLYEMVLLSHIPTFVPTPSKPADWGSTPAQTQSLLFPLGGS